MSKQQLEAKMFRVLADNSVEVKELRISREDCDKTMVYTLALAFAGEDTEVEFLISEDEAKVVMEYLKEGTTGYAVP